MFKAVLVLIAAAYFVAPAHASVTGAINVPAYAYVGTEYVTMPNATMVIREIYVPNLSNGVCNTLKAKYVTDGFIATKFPNGQTYTSHKIGDCVQMFTPVTDVTPQ